MDKLWVFNKNQPAYNWNAPHTHTERDINFYVTHTVILVTGAFAKYSIIKVYFGFITGVFF